MYASRGRLLELIQENQVVILSGDTGCGKTTQVPQFILEKEIGSGRGALCNIICTQPRRISAIGVAERVAAERCTQLGKEVGYQIRLDNKTSYRTRLRFCTMGILLRRLLLEPNLDGISHIVIDEAHERQMEMDFALIILQDLLERRPDLRLVIMSATLQASLFSEYFGGAPVISVEVRAGWLIPTPITQCCMKSNLLPVFCREEPSL
jgi:ATP-dependent RNA helicase DHX36